MSGGKGAMTWGKWLVPELPLSTEARLRASELEIHAAIHSEPERVANLAVLLMRQNLLQESIIRNAIRRMSELEAREAAAEDPGRRQGVAYKPWWKRLLRELQILG